MFSKIAGVMLIAIYLFAAVGCGSADVVTKEVTVEKNPADASLYPDTPAGDDGTTEHPIGEAAPVGSHTETLMKVEYPYKPEKIFSEATPGTRYLRITVKISNTSTHEIDYNPFFYKVEDSNKVQSDYTSDVKSVGGLSSGTLAVGQEVVGSLVYEIPSGVEPVVLLAEQGHKNPPTRFKLT